MSRSICSLHLSKARSAQARAVGRRTGNVPKKSRSSARQGGNNLESADYNEQIRIMRAFFERRIVPSEAFSTAAGRGAHSATLPGHLTLCSTTNRHPVRLPWAALMARKVLFLGRDSIKNRIKPLPKHVLSRRPRQAGTRHPSAPTRPEFIPSDPASRPQRRQRSGTTE